MYIDEYNFCKKTKKKQPDLKSYLVNFSYKNKLFHFLKLMKSAVLPKTL